ncbi:MAG: alternative ribosome rescue aminoacyl-tRNA hydrolase ArfB [Candidatus Neomarinimicrobiota bacterium]
MHITPEIIISESEIREKFVRSSGPGGQNVNKVATAVQLVFNINQCETIPDDVKKRLIRLSGKRVNESGILRISSSKYRSQSRNRDDARERLVKLIKRAAEPQVKRIETNPPKSADMKRLNDKKRQGLKKALRQAVQPDSDI